MILNYLSKIQWKNILKIFLSLVIVFLILFSSFSCLLYLPSYAAEVDSALGVWQFNNTPLTTNVNFGISFTSNGVSYSGITVGPAAFGDPTLGLFYGGTCVGLNQETPGGQQLIFYPGYSNIINITGGADISNQTCISWLNTHAVKLDNSGEGTGGGETPTCPTLEDLLYDYTGSFDSIVGMLNSTNYQQYVDSFPTLPELLHDYTGSFDSIVDMLNSKNYSEYNEYIEYKYSEGVNAGASDNLVKNFFGDMLSGVVRAIDSIVLFRSGDFYISVWTVLTTVVITSLMIGLLKIWRGG